MIFLLIEYFLILALMVIFESFEEYRPKIVFIGRNYRKRKLSKMLIICVLTMENVRECLIIDSDLISIV